MANLNMVESLVKERAGWPKEDMSLVLLVLDGIGDIRHPDHGMQTPLEKAKTPNLDALASKSALGRMLPVDYGITPGSGPAHLGLFGYDPREVEIGRGVLETLGLDMDLEFGDLAARCNFCTIEDGVITDRRAGRPATEDSVKLCSQLQAEISKIEDVEVIIKPGMGHRFAVIFRGPDLHEGVCDTDPHENGAPLHKAQAANSDAEKAAKIIGEFQNRALKVLEGNDPMNAILVRGIAERPKIASIEERFKLKSGAIATYPMYRGLAKLVGMNVVDTGSSVEDEFKSYQETRSEFDYHFIHVKGTDEAGEDGDFDYKVEVVEEVDSKLPMVLDQKPDALAITGDHSTPCPMKLHSWHPVPLLLHSERCDVAGADKFTELECSHKGTLGTFHSMHLISLMLANSALLDKYGA